MGGERGCWRRWVREEKRKGNCGVRNCAHCAQTTDDETTDDAEGTDGSLCNSDLPNRNEPGQPEEQLPLETPSGRY